MPPCFLCSPELAPVVAESRCWRLVLNLNQNFLGKCMWVLRRHIEPVSDLSADEWAELHPLIGRTRNMLDAVFQPDHYNYAFMQNQDRHVHLHIIPRYADVRVFAGLTFSDPDWPGHYTSLNPPRRLSPESMTTLTEHLRLIWSQETP